MRFVHILVGFLPDHFGLWCSFLEHPEAVGACFVVWKGPREVGLDPRGTRHRTRCWVSMETRPSGALLPWMLKAVRTDNFSGALRPCARGLRIPAPSVSRGEMRWLWRLPNFVLGQRSTINEVTRVDSPWLLGLGRREPGNGITRNSLCSFTEQYVSEQFPPCQHT